MYDYSGILYRIWGECGVIATIGVLCLLIVFCEKGNKKNKETAIAGWGGILLALGLCIFYVFCLIKPDVQMFQGTFESEYRNSRVAPPLPLTMEYNFRDEDGQSHTAYLDVLSKKDIIPMGFTEGQQYTVYYEERTNVILRVE